MHCRDCSSSSNTGDIEIIDVETITEILEYFADTDAYEMKKQSRHIVSGGEPTLHPGLADMLECSMDKWYETMLVTNGSWVNLDDDSATLKFLEEDIPRGVVICCAYNSLILEQEPRQLEKIRVLKEVTAKRNRVKAEVMYNGKEDFSKLQTELLRNGVIMDSYFVPKEDMGLGRCTPNLNTMGNEKPECPKGLNKGFTVTPEGIYYCLRGAMNKIPRYMLTDSFAPRDIAAAMDLFQPHRVNQILAKAYASATDRTGFSDACDVCECAARIWERGGFN